MYPQLHYCNYDNYCNILSRSKWSIEDPSTGCSFHRGKEHCGRPVKTTYGDIECNRIARIPYENAGGCKDHYNKINLCNFPIQNECGITTDYCSVGSNIEYKDDGGCDMHMYIKYCNYNDENEYCKELISYNVKHCAKHSISNKQYLKWCILF
jgi:hypothetical protein